MEAQHEQREVDVKHAARGVWLVKVPKYLAEKWDKSGGEVGRLRISNPKVKGGKPEVIFTLGEKLAAQTTNTMQPCPRDHKFVLTGIDGQSLSVIGREPNISSTGDELAEKVSIQGRVIQRAECRPIVDKSYINLKRATMDIKNKPKKETKVIDRVVNAYKPVSQHENEVEHQRKKKEDGKRSRLDKQAVMDVLFKAFEKHQYYNVKDLVRISQQPVVYLKDILKEICNYNMKAPHRNMWELKPEYRHYKQDASEDT